MWPRWALRCSTEPVFRELVRAGLDVARLNFSHGTHPEKLKLIEMVRKVSDEEGKPICILGDLQGPKIRTGRLKNRIPVQLKAGQRLMITPRDIAGTSTLIGTTFPTLAENLEPGARILLSDGLIELLRGRGAWRGRRVRGNQRRDARASTRASTCPASRCAVPSLTNKDEEDLEFAIRSGVDAIAVSFVRTAEDIRLVQQRVAAMGAETWIIAKLEKPQAIEHLESILEAADGVMVARGDLGVEMPPEKVPAIQKHVIRRAGDYRKPVITATQMLESMIENPRPTRAEASRRGERHLRRHRRGDAVGGNRGRQVSRRGGQDDGQDRHRDRKPGAAWCGQPIPDSRDMCGSRSRRRFVNRWPTPPRIWTSALSRSLRKPGPPPASSPNTGPNRRFLA